MKKTAKNTALTALLTALTVTLLYLSAIIPTMKLALIAAAGILTAAAVIECGRAYGMLMFAAAVLLGLLVSPLRGNILVYLFFFGYYPVAKSAFEHVRPRIVEWALKFLLFNAALTAALITYRAGFLSGIELAYAETAYIILYAAANAAFAVYDLGLTKLIALYLTRIRRAGHGR